MKRVAFPLLLAASLALFACSDKPGDAGKALALPALSSQFQNTDVTGLDFAGNFALTDHTGKPRTLADFRGKAVVVFFGYTQCPDVCPTTMAEMAAAMKELGPLADRVQVLFISLDPERDSPQLLAQYVPAFDSRFLGLTGDKAATDKAAQDFKVFYQKVPGKTPGSYTIDHSAGSYVFDPQGRVRLFIRHGQGAAPIAHDIRLLLADKGK